jgi:hypothetical protein
MYSHKYSCNICNDKYSHKSDYYNHQRKHFSPEYIYILDQEFINKFCCKICMVLFKTHNSFIFHICNHSYEELYAYYDTEYIDNAFKIKQKKQEYNNICYKKYISNENNRIKRRASQTVYRIINKEKILEKNRTIYKKNKKNVLVDNIFELLETQML